MQRAVVTLCMASGAMICATFFFLAASFPQWDVRWGGRNRFGPGHRTPMATDSRKASGVFFAGVGIMVVCCHYSVYTLFACMPAAIILLEPTKGPANLYKADGSG
jgi:hypothetical protein